jgi:hypothetical protein
VFLGCSRISRGRYSGDDALRHGFRLVRPIAGATISRTCPARTSIVRRPILDYVAIEYQLHTLVTMFRAFVAAFFLICATPAIAEEPAVTITLRDHQFVPAEVAVPAGVRIKLIIRNEQATNAEFESTSLHREKVVNSGGEIAVFVGPLDPGSYEFFDDFHGETRGHLVVK